MQVLENEFLKIGVVELGSELVSVFNKELNQELLWQGDDQYWGGQSPHLFPFIGKVFENKYKVDGVEYELPQHGFLRRRHMSHVTSTENTLVYRFEYDAESLAVYPYKHAVEITYTLNEKRLEVTWKVINLDDKTMYYSIGAHPGFNIDKSHKYTLEYEVDGKTQQAILGKGYLDHFVDVEIQDIEVDESTFINDAVMYTGCEAVSLVDQSTGYRIRCDFKGFEYIAVWSTLNTGAMAPFICLEPWRGIVDDFGGFKDISEMRGIQSVKVGESDSNTYGLEF